MLCQNFEGEKHTFLILEELKAELNETINLDKCKIIDLNEKVCLSVALGVCLLLLNLHLTETAISSQLVVRIAKNSLRHLFIYSPCIWRVLNYVSVAILEYSD